MTHDVQHQDDHIRELLSFLQVRIEPKSILQKQKTPPKFLPETTERLTQYNLIERCLALNWSKEYLHKGQMHENGRITGLSD